MPSFCFYFQSLTQFLRKISPERLGKKETGKQLREKKKLESAYSLNKQKIRDDARLTANKF